MIEERPAWPLFDLDDRRAQLNRWHVLPHYMPGSEAPPHHSLVIAWMVDPGNPPSLAAAVVTPDAVQADVSGRKPDPDPRVATTLSLRASDVGANSGR
jgi:hypothetical protein